VRHASLSLLLALLVATPLVAQESSDPVAQALSQGDLYSSKRKYELALDAYHKADKLSHHSSAPCYLKIAGVERKLGDFSSALDNAKKAVKVAGGDTPVAVRAHLLRATLLSQMSGKSTDKKLKEAEDEIRQAISLDSSNAVARYDLGFVLLKQERDPEGTAELNAFLAMSGQDSETVAEARRLVANPLRARAPFAPDFSFTTYQKQEISNISLRGKVVLVDFWGTWCPPCRESVPALRNLNKKYAGKPFQLVSVSSDDDEDVWKTFIKAERMEWSQYIDLPGEVLHAFKVDSFPTFVVLDKDGVIRFRQSGEGPQTESELEDAINKYLKRESDPKLAAAAAAEGEISSSPADSTSNASRTSSSTRASSAGTSPSISSAASTENVKRNRDFPASLPGVEGSIVSAGVYKNQTLGMTFQFPSGWVLATPDAIHALNERTEAAAQASILQQRPELANSLNLSVPKVVFYASRKGGDAQRIEVPSIRITAAQSRLDSVSLSNFEVLVASRATASGLKSTSAASEFQVNKHPFVRADFERSVGTVHVYQSFVQTIAGDYLLNIEIYAYSLDELQQVAASLQSMSIADEDP
jgi:thiol-disulfide isomerase/thioredoxin